MCFSNIAPYPHSLSYHESTLTKFPSTTRVKTKSIIEPYSSPKISDETIGSSHTRKIPFHSGDSAAFLKISFISSAEVSRDATKVKSIREPEITGTRMAIPSNLPFINGAAFITASAAPVLDGTMFAAAARPRLKSLLSGPSTRFWVAVYPCTVFKTAFLIPGFCIIIAVTGVAAFVVQEAFEVIRDFSIKSAPTFGVNVTEALSSLAGAVITTLFAPASRCGLAFSNESKTQVDSTTTSIFKSFHGSLAG